MVTRGDQQEVLIWTDGSKIHNRAGYGVYFGKNSNINMAGPWETKPQTTWSCKPC